ncbi:MAG: flagellar assembly protein FliH [Variovorax sp.]|nr:MAG: flagellar assembly protein FliH [Variovorax sp.]
MRSSFIPSESIARCARWQFGAVGASDGTPDADGGIVDPEALAAARSQGHAEGHAAGRAEALAEARAAHAAEREAQVAGEAAALAALMRAMEARLADAEQDMARGTLEIACALARQVLRRELSIDPAALVPVVREALGLLLAEGRSATVRLSPQDFDRLGDGLRAELAGGTASVVADAGVAPGDCLVESAGAVVDGGLANRWARAVGSLGLNLPWNEEGADVA